MKAAQSIENAKWHFDCQCFRMNPQAIFVILIQNTCQVFFIRDASAFGNHILSRDAACADITENKTTASRKKIDHYS